MASESPRELSGKGRVETCLFRYLAKWAVFGEVILRAVLTLEPTETVPATSPGLFPLIVSIVRSFFPPHTAAEMHLHSPSASERTWKALRSGWSMQGVNYMAGKARYLGGNAILNLIAWSL